MKKLTALLFLILLCSTLTAHARTIIGVPPEQADIRIGCMFPMTGKGGLYGHDSMVGIQMALEALKDEPINVSIILEDTKSKPSRAVNIAKHFIEKDHVTFLCGVVSSSVALAITEVSKERKVPFIGTDHASSRLIDDAFQPYYFRVTNDVRYSMAAGALYLKDLAKTKKWKRIAFIGPDYDYGHRAWLDLKSALNILNVPYEVVGEYWSKLYEPDYSAYITELVEAKPDIIINAHWGGDLVAFIRQALTFQLFDKAIFCNFDTGGNYEVMSALQNEIPLGIIMSARHHNNWPQTRTNIEFVQTFKRLSGRYPSYTAHGAYAGVIAMAKAYLSAEKDKSINNIVRQLENIKIKLPKDPNDYLSYMDTETHQIVQTQAIGTVVPNFDYPPATRMLSNWQVYWPEELQPLVQQMRSQLLYPNN